jgi:hypothetical protein
MENLKFVDPSFKGPAYFEGFLKKLKSENSYSKLFGKFNKRFFVLDLLEYSFSYRKNKSSRKNKKFSLNDLDLVDDHPRISVKSDWKFPFLVKFTKKTFTLHSESMQDHLEWCKILKACVKPLTSNLVFASFTLDNKKKNFNVTNLNSFEGVSIGNDLKQTPKFREFEGFFESPSEVMRKKVALTEIFNSRKKISEDEDEIRENRSGNFHKTEMIEAFGLKPVFIVEDDGCEEVSGLIAPVCTKSDYFKDNFKRKVSKSRTGSRAGIKQDLRNQLKENQSHSKSGLFMKVKN